MGSPLPKSKPEFQRPSPEACRPRPLVSRDGALGSTLGQGDILRPYVDLRRDPLPSFWLLSVVRVPKLQVIRLPLTEL